MEKVKEEVKSTKTTKKTTNKKSTTKKKEEPKLNDIKDVSPELMAQMFQMFQQMQQQNDQSQNNKVKEEPKKEEKKKYTKLDLLKMEDEKIYVEALTSDVGYISDRGIIYNWNNKGDIELMNISEILAMEQRSDKYFHTPWLKITDERVIEALGLEGLYETIDSLKDMNVLTKMNKEQIQNAINSLPSNFKKEFTDEVYYNVKNKKLNDLNTIDILSEILDYKFRDVK